MKQFYLLLFLCISFHFALGQIDFTPYPGNATHCPGELLRYTASGTNCGVFTWTITNGKILNPANNSEVTTLTGPYVDIRWNDVASTGKLKVSATCGGEVKFEEKNFAIRSLNGRVPQNPRANQSLTYCTILPINIAVDIMWLENTGGTTGVDQQRADGYEWILPTGWSYNGSPGTVRTPQEFINIAPDNGCRTGTVTVKAYMNCGSGRKYSSSASINLNRVGFNSNLGVPSGYTGPKCGNTNPVTFTAANLTCATSYRWTATNTNWKDAQGNLGAWTTSTNTITLYPSGDPSDQGVITVDINIGCATLTQTYNAVYTDPLLSNPVFTSSSSMVLCSNGTGTVSINPVPDASTYTWYGPSNVLINNVATSPTNPVVTTTTNVTIKAPSLSPGANGFAAFIHVTASRANLNCSGSPDKMHKVWVGRPAMVNRIMLGHLEPIFELCTSTIYQFDAIDPINQMGYTTYYWYKPENSTIMSGQGTKTLRLKTGNLPMSYAWLSVRADNTCGNSDIANAQLVINNCSGGGRTLTLTAYPNPTSEELNVTLAEDGDNSLEEYKILLFNENQEKVSDTKLSEHKATINVRGYKKGVYYLHLVDKMGNVSDQMRILINN